MKKLMVVLVSVVALNLTACGGEDDVAISDIINSDGSLAFTYSSCSIRDSGALLASDRATDLQQCWDGADFLSTEKDKALQWCKEITSEYMGQRYTIGHPYEYQVLDTNCP